MMDETEVELKRSQAAGLKGVFYDARIDKFTSTAMIGGRRNWLGAFATAVEAAQAYEDAKAEAKAKKAAKRGAPRPGPNGTSTRRPMTHAEAAQRGLSFRPATRSTLTREQKVQLRSELGFGPETGPDFVERFNAFLQAESRRTGLTLGPLVDQLWGARDFV